MATTMENIRATTKINRRVGTALLGLLMAGFACMNLFGTMTPTMDLNTKISTRLHAAATLPENRRGSEYNQLKSMQEKALSARPADPYGWERLSYLRNKIGNNDEYSFAALRMSDIVSPFETLELPERAVMWMKFRSVQTTEEKDYQDILWIKSYLQSPEQTWDFASGLNLTREVGASINRKNQGLAASWYRRMAAAGIDAD